MSSFEERMNKAIDRGRYRNADRQRAEHARRMNLEELKKLHSQYRLQLSDRIEHCLRQLPNHFPGFQLETMFGDRGWGAAASRDDVAPKANARRTNFFSRLEMTIRPFSDLHVVELTAKGTIRNKEVFNRSHYEMIDDVDIDTFNNLIDVWVLDYAELFAARR